jgi:phosphoserine phosphatase
MYTDSSNDLPLIKKAKNGFMVKKNKIMSYYDYKPSILKRIIKYILKIYDNRELFCYLVF